VINRDGALEDDPEVIKDRGGRIATAIFLGCLIEFLLIMFIRWYEPDPPVDLIDVLCFVSQLPGLLMGYVLPLVGFHLSSSTSIFVTLGFLQTPFWILLVYWVDLSWRKYRIKSDRESFHQNLEIRAIKKDLDSWTMLSPNTDRET